MIATLFNPTVIAECCTLLAAIFLLKKNSGRWQLFIPVLLVTIIAETLGWAWTYLFHKRGNGWIFNINLLMTSAFYFWLLSFAGPLQQLKSRLLTCVAIFFLFASLNALFGQGFTAYQTYTDIFAELMLIVTGFYFFYKVLTEEIYRNVFRYEYFWLVNGLLLYALGGVVLYAFYEVIVAYDKLHKVHLYGLINYIINGIFYGSLIIAFVCRNKTQELS